MLIPVKPHQIWCRIASIFADRAEGGLCVHELEAQLVRERDEIARHVAELARLRAENRALLNSILGIAGIPPVLVDTPPPDFAALPSSVSLPAKCHSESAAADDESRSTPSHPSSIGAEKNSPGTQRPRNDIPPNPSPESSSLRFSATSSEPASSSPPVPRRHPLRRTTPLRRRSWHQIMRTLEFESGKKLAATD